MDIGNAHEHDCIQRCNTDPFFSDDPPSIWSCYFCVPLAHSTSPSTGQPFPPLPLPHRKSLRELRQKKKERGTRARLPTFIGPPISYIQRGLRPPHPTRAPDLPFIPRFISRGKQPEAEVEAEEDELFLPRFLQGQNILTHSIVNARSRKRKDKSDGKWKSG